MRREAALPGVDHLRHHGRFYAAALLGLLVWAVLGGRAEAHGFLVAGDASFAAYLVLMAATLARATAAQMRERAAYEDEGILVIAVIALAAVALSLGSVFAVLVRPGPMATSDIVLAVASVPLAWLTLHAMAAFHYGHLYYARAEPGAKRRDRGGLAFPDTEEPVASDFLYHAFVIGVAAQVSDVQVTSAGMRRLVLAHGVVAFFFNTVIVALAVSTASQGH